MKILSINGREFLIDTLGNKIINTSIIFIAFMVLPLNAIIFIALDESVFLWPRFAPPIMGLTAIILAFYRNKMNFRFKIWSFSILLFLAGSFNLLLGLIDMASLWYVLAIIYSLFSLKKWEPLVIFIFSFIAILIVGILMITNSTFIPLDYHFESCHYTCVIVRILHFLLIGFLIYYILVNFFSRIRSNINELQTKASELEIINSALNNEMAEKKEIQQKMIDTIILTEEKERKRIASDLHDGLGPVLSAINLYYQAYLDAPEQESKIEIEIKLKEIIKTTIEDVSRISHNISPNVLENYGLIFALENFISHIAPNENIKFDLHFEKILRFGLIKELTLYRTITELLNNTFKHATASLISISITQQNELLKVLYKDNGKGFSVDEKMQNKSGMGLANIKSRIQSLNGTVKFESTIEKGTIVFIEIPYHKINEEHFD
ncbi:MAG: sensor histidine kinase [Bacteroidetes bacterium]|nr:sensor histidine kinase [Bacteroidota bacterium]